MARRTCSLDGKNVYVLSDQKMPDRFAGQKVSVVGTLDQKTKTIRVESITASTVGSIAGPAASALDAERVSGRKTSKFPTRVRV